MMAARRRQAVAWIAIALGTMMTAQAWAQFGPPFGRGPGGRGQGGDPQFAVDRDVFQFLLANHEQIRRRVTQRADGVETLTESDSPEIAAKIQEHVEAMHRRILEVRPIRVRDPLFAEIFRHAGQIEMTVEKTKQGVKVVERSQDPYVAKLIQAHAAAVDGFVRNGFAEARRDHAVPAAKAAAAARSADEPGVSTVALKTACAACPGAVATSSACGSCPNAAGCPAGKTCPAGTGAGRATCPSAAQAGTNCQSCPLAAGAVNAGCQSCPKAISDAACKACPAASANGCQSCPMSTQCPGGVARPAAGGDADAPPPLNQGLKKS